MRKILFLLTILSINFFVYAGDYTRNNEIVTDHSTGLMWQDDRGAKDRTYEWSDAIKYCNNLSLGGYSDWRLPNKNELESIVDYTKYKPAIDSAFRNVNSSLYWSSTTFAVSVNGAWGVGFVGGGDDGDDKSDVYYARCVRGGQ